MRSTRIFPIRLTLWIIIIEYGALSVFNFDNICPAMCTACDRCDKKKESSEILQQSMSKIVQNCVRCVNGRCSFRIREERPRGGLGKEKMQWNSMATTTTRSRAGKTNSNRKRLLPTPIAEKWIISGMRQQKVFYKLFFLFYPLNYWTDIFFRHSFF